MLMHIKDIQLEILRRATQQKQDELNALVEQKLDLAVSIDAQRAPPSRPLRPVDHIPRPISFDYANNSWWEYLLSNYSGTTRDDS